MWWSPRATPGIAAGRRPRSPVTGAPPEEIDADLIVIGPEAPLVDGLADRLRARGVPVFGPGADGARLEGSKAFMKEVLAEAGVPTARYGAFDDAAADGRWLLAELPGPWVVKTDGLAAGKGVLVTDDAGGGRGRRCGQAVRGGLRRGRAPGGRRRGAVGEECSLLVLCDGGAPCLWPRPGLQAGGRRGRRAQHRRHGRLRPVPHVDDALVAR